MPRQQGWFSLILGLALAAFIACNSLPFQLGLDLQGGSQLTLEVETTEEIPQIKNMIIIG